MDTTLAQLKAQIEELEKRIKSLSNQVTTQGYMTGLKTCLEDIKTLFSLYQTQLNEHLVEYTEHSQEFEAHKEEYQTLNSAVSEIQQNIQTINSVIASLSGVTQDIQDIKDEIESVNTQLDGHVQDYNSLNQDYLSHKQDFTAHKQEYQTLNSAVVAIMQDIQTIKSTLSSMGDVTQDISSIQEDLNNLSASLSQTNITVSNLSTNYDSANENITNIETDVETLTTQVVQLQNSDIELDSRITALESSQGSSSEGSGGQQDSESEELGYNFDQMRGKIFRPDGYDWQSPRCQFCCDTSGQVTIKYQVNGSIVGTDGPTYRRIRLSLNGVEVKDLIVDTFSDAFILSDSYQFKPTKKYNYFQIQVNIGSVMLREYNISIEGKNVQFLEHDLPLKICCFNDSYYIVRTDDYRQRIYYGVQAKDSLDIDDLEYISTSYLPSTGVCYFYLIPTTKVVNGLVQFDTNYPNNYKIATVDGGKVHSLITYTFGDSAIEQESSWQIPITHLEPICGGIGHDIATSDFQDALFRITVEGIIGISGLFSSTGANVTIFSLNGVEINSSNYKVGGVVRNNNNKIGAPSAYHGCVLTDCETMMNVYFPDVDSTYTLDIAKGRNVTAYYQPNGNINVYMNRGFNVYKYVLQKNTDTGKYEVSNEVTTIEGITRYEELYDGSYLVYRNLDYEIVTP